MTESKRAGLNVSSLLSSLDLGKGRGAGDGNSTHAPSLASRTRIGTSLCGVDFTRRTIISLRRRTRAVGRSSRLDMGEAGESLRRKIKRLDTNNGGSGPAYITAVSYSTHGSLLATGYSDGSILVLKVPLVGAPKAYQNSQTDRRGHRVDVFRDTQSTLDAMVSRSLPAGKSHDDSSFPRSHDHLLAANEVPTFRRGASLVTLCVPRAHRGHILGLEFSDEGRMLFSCSTDRTVCLWDINHQHHVSLNASSSLMRGRSKHARRNVMSVGIGAVLGGRTGTRSLLGIPRIPKSAAESYAEYKRTRQEDMRLRGGVEASAAGSKDLRAHSRTPTPILRLTTHGGNVSDMSRGPQMLVTVCGDGFIRVFRETGELTDVLVFPSFACQQIMECPDGSIPTHCCLLKRGGTSPNLLVADNQGHLHTLVASHSGRPGADFAPTASHSTHGGGGTQSISESMLPSLLDRNARRVVSSRSPRDELTANAVGSRNARYYLTRTASLHEAGVCGLFLANKEKYIVTMGFDNRCLVLDSWTETIVSTFVNPYRDRYVACSYDSAMAYLLLTDCAGRLHVCDVTGDKIVKIVCVGKIRGSGLNAVEIGASMNFKDIAAKQLGTGGRNVDGQDMGSFIHMCPVPFAAHSRASAQPQGRKGVDQYNMCCVMVAHRDGLDLWDVVEDTSFFDFTAHNSSVVGITFVDKARENSKDPPPGRTPALTDLRNRPGFVLSSNVDQKVVAAISSCLYTVSKAVRVKAWSLYDYSLVTELTDAVADDKLDLRLLSQLSESKSGPSGNNDGGALSDLVMKFDALSVGGTVDQHVLSRSQSQMPRTPPTEITVLTVVPDSILLVTGHDNGVLRFWNTDNGSFMDVHHHVGSIADICVSKVFHWRSTVRSMVQRGGGGGEQAPSPQSGSSNNGVSLSEGRHKNASLCVLSLSVDGILAVWLCHRWQTIGALPEFSIKVSQGIVSCCAYSAVHHMAATGDNDGTIRVWDLQSQTLVHELTGHDGAVSKLLFDGNVLISAGDCVVSVWDFTAGVCLQSLTGVHKGPVRDLCMYPGHPVVLSCSFDGVIHGWFYPTGRTLLLYRHNISCTRLVCFRSTLFVGTDGGEVYVLPLSVSESQLAEQERLMIENMQEALEGMNGPTIAP